MNCSRCRNAIEQGLKFCENCGAMAAPGQPIKAETGSMRNASDQSVQMYSQLEKLADLKAKGALTEEEFQEQKTRLLSGTQGSGAGTSQRFPSTCSASETTLSRTAPVPALATQQPRSSTSRTGRWVLIVVGLLAALVLFAAIVSRSGGSVNARSTQDEKPLVAATQQAPVREPIAQTVPPDQTSTPAPEASPGDKEKYHGHDSYESCMSAGNSEEKVNCSADEFEREDVRLNREYKRVMAQYKTQGREDSVAALRKAQVAWLKSMTTECDSLRPNEIYTCRLYWTKTRADELAKLP